MICTFGDTTDVTWWRELHLGMRVIIGRDGRLLADAPDDVDPDAYALIAGKYPNQAQRAVVDQLTEQGLLIGRAPATATSGQVLRDAAIAHSKSSPRVSGTSATAAATLNYGPPSSSVETRSPVHPDHMQSPLRELGRRPQRGLADQSPAVLRSAGPDLVLP